MLYTLKPETDRLASTAVQAEHRVGAGADAVEDTGEAEGMQTQCV